MLIPKSIAQIKLENPFPWVERQAGPQIFLVDAAGKQVPLFTATAFIEHTTAHLAAQPAAAA